MTLLCGRDSSSLCASDRVTVTNNVLLCYLYTCSLPSCRTLYYVQQICALHLVLKKVSVALCEILTFTVTVLWSATHCVIVAVNSMSKAT